AQGYPLSYPEIDLGDQAKVVTHGHALQCRVTTEDPGNNFLPDYGRLSTYRSASGMGIRLDAPQPYTPPVIPPSSHSLLRSVPAQGPRLGRAPRRMERSLQEFRVRGVKTNIPFLINLVTHPDFLAGRCTTRFIDETPELFRLPQRQDRATRILAYIAEVVVNGHPDVKGKPRPVPPDAPVEEVDILSPARQMTIPQGTRDTFHHLGPEKFSAWVREQPRLLVTDTTFRDAHQSLLATRMRTYDMLRVMPTYAVRHARLFSLEM